MARPRRVMSDVMRLAAAYSIVWLHTPRSTALHGSMVLGRSAVPFFAAATVFFVWQGLVDSPGRGWLAYAATRFRRIYVPFMAWSAIYLAFKAVKASALPNEPNDFPGWEFLWTGSFYHLWFMPFILVVSLSVACLGRLVIGSKIIEIGTAIFCLVAGIAIAVLPIPAVIVGTSAAFAYSALPAVCWGVTLSVACHRGRTDLVQNSVAAVLGLIMAAACTTWVWHYGRDNLAENLAGIGCMFAALAPWSARALVTLARLGSLAYGIYLSHLLFIKSAEAGLSKLGADKTWQLDLLVFVTAAIGSTALAWCLTQTRYTRWLVA